MPEVQGDLVLAGWFQFKSTGRLQVCLELFNRLPIEVDHNIPSRLTCYVISIIVGTSGGTQAKQSATPGTIKVLLSRV